MAVARRESTITVVAAARQRIINTFRNGLPVYMSFSGGKDSLCLSQLTLDLIQEGKIDAGQLIVQFVDEEAIFPCIEKTTMDWHRKFLLAGVRFEWYCVEVKHYNCFNALTNDETFICWDRTKESAWVRRPPTFAIRSHPLLKPRVDAYQDWLPRACMDGISLTGIRTAESIQRLKSIAEMNYAGKAITKRQQIFPIYDWSNNDVWLFLKEKHVDIPEIYLYLWQSGTSKDHLRVSQFFSVDTARSLVNMNEYYPDLMERIIRREPNAYLAALYWDSEMFGRSTKRRREMEQGEKKDYKAELLKLFSNMDLYFDTPHKRYIAKQYRNFFIKAAPIATEQDYKEIFEGLISGDPKLRTYRALLTRVYGRYINNAKAERSVKHEPVAICPAGDPAMGETGSAEAE